MHIFLGLEGYLGVGSKWRKITSELEPMINARVCEITHPAFDSIAVISIIMPEEYLADYKERDYLSRKDRYADIRLHVNWKEFTCSSEQKRSRLYVEHLIDSIQRMERKMKTKEERAAFDELKTAICSVSDEYLSKTERGEDHGK
ncbi:MAG: hypothetical protein J5772_02900 [Clostridia bacterium]|nr:hypothetical protein [Clostridia bacterium]